MKQKNLQNIKKMHTFYQGNKCNNYVKEVKNFGNNIHVGT